MSECVCVFGRPRLRVCVLDHIPLLFGALATRVANDVVGTLTGPSSTVDNVLAGMMNDIVCALEPWVR